MTQAKRRNKTRKKPARKRANHSSWGMLTIGLISGSVLAALIFGTQGGDNGGFGSGLKTLFRQAANSPAESKIEKPIAAKHSPKPKLDFYTVLPRIERIIQDDPPPPEQKKTAVKDEKAWYVLQVASYQGFNDADRLKARLTINGFDAAVQKVTIEDKIYYRVRLGPYDSQRKLKNVKQALGELGYAGMSLKITNP